MKDSITDIRYCTACGALTQERIPVDDDHKRAVCTDCGQVHYSNPKMVVGCIPEYKGKLLLARRNIEPRKGYWTLPAGFLENGESVQQGALRETLEETKATAEIIEPYRLFNIVFVNQIYFIFRARMTGGRFGPTTESIEVRLFDEDEIPWDDIAFEVIRQTLLHYFEDKKKGRFSFKVLDLKVPARLQHLDEPES